MKEIIGQRDSRIVWNERHWAFVSGIRIKRNKAKCDLLQRAVGQVTEQSICLFSQYFYFEKYVVLGKSNHMNSDESKSQRQENLIDFESPF